MGRTARFDQIYVASLDAQPIEEETLTGVTSILTKEIEADEIVSDKFAVSNTAPSKSISVSNKLFIDKDDSIVFDLKERGRASRFFVDNQLSIGTTNPTKTFQINDNSDINKVNVDLFGRDLMTVYGNLVSTNVIVSDKIITPGSNIIIDQFASNVVKVIGTTHSTNLVATSNLNIGSNIEFFDQGANVALINGNVSLVDGFLRVNGNIEVTGNIFVSETARYKKTVNLVVEDSIIMSGTGNDAGVNETGFLMTPGGAYSNVAMGFVGGDRGREFAFFATEDFAEVSTFTIDRDTLVNVHVYGDIYTANNIGAANTYPTHDLCIGSNVFFEDVGSNVMYANGNVYAKGIVVGPNGLKAGNLLTLDPTSQTPATINSNVKVFSLRTTGTFPSGISNLTPTDTLSIGTHIYANTSASSVLRVLGNTETTNLITEVVYSHSNILFHADRYGGDSVSNTLVIKSGPYNSNTSSIEIGGARQSSANQFIKMKTRNKDRFNITSEGYVGISNTSPNEKLTIDGGIYVKGSNVITVGNIWGSGGNTSMRSYSLVNSGENKIENIVGSGKGLKVYASTTSAMGTPKLTILETSNVGINVGNPVGRLHTSGGTVFLNDQPTYRNGYNHLDSSLVVTNTEPIVDTTDLGTVMHLAREGNETRDGVRATFKMGKHDNTSGKSKAKLDIYLSDETYADEVDVMTLQSEGRVGIGTTQPAAHLEVYCTGTGNPTTNGILVHNHESPSGDAIVAMQTDINEGNAFTSYIQTDGDVDPSGWAVGVTGSNDFRITQNPNKVYDTGSVGLFINGTSRNVGIGTDSPREKLEVKGNVVVGQSIIFGGITGDEYPNTQLIERRYGDLYSKSELIIFKGNDATSVDQGPDRIRHIAGEHVFQTYESSGENFYGPNQILDDLGDLDIDTPNQIPMVVCDNGIVVVGGNRSDADNRATNTKLVVNGDIEFGGGGAFRLSGLTFSTTDATESVPSYNIIKNIIEGDNPRDLTFVTETSDSIQKEYMRIDTIGRVGIGTSDITSNIHVYSPATTDVDILRLESPGDNKETGILIYTNPDEGGYIKGFSNTENKTTGLVMGVSNNSIVTNCIHLLHDSNVGIGTATPSKKLHVYGGDLRIEDHTSNAIIDLITTGGSSNIYADTTGNIHINPSSINPVTYINSNIEITGDLVVGGAIDFGEQVAIGLGGSEAETSLHVGGGMITNSLDVASKRYSKTFSIGEGLAKDVQFIFGTGAFYAKITAILRRTDGSTVKDLNTIILEIQGGTGNESVSTVDIAVGTNNIFGGTNSYPWSPVVTTGRRGISITPYNVDSARIYSYDVYVELVSACNGKLIKITRDLSSPANLDTENGGDVLITSFSY